MIDLRSGLGNYLAGVLLLGGMTACMATAVALILDGATLPLVLALSVVASAMSYAGSRQIRKAGTRFFSPAVATLPAGERSAQASPTALRSTIVFFLVGGVGTLIQSMGLVYGVHVLGVTLSARVVGLLLLAPMLFCVFVSWLVYRALKSQVTPTPNDDASLT